MATPGADRARPLVITADPELLDELLRLAAVGFGEVDVAPDPAAARSLWSVAPLVVIARDAAPACIRARLPRRTQVVLVAGLGPDATAEDDAWAMAGRLGAEHVVLLPAAESWLVERFAAAGTEPAVTGQVIGVVGGRGGAGASVLAAGLAVTAVRDRGRVMLIDADPLGGGVDLLLGWENSNGLRWPDLAGVQGRMSVPALYDSLPRAGDLIALSWDRGDPVELTGDAMVAALDAARRGSDLAIVDLPRHLDEPALGAFEAADVVFLVVPAEVRACAAAARVASRIGPQCARLEVVVRGPAPAGLRPVEIATALGLPLAATLRPDPGLARALERGEQPAARGTGPLAEVCRELLAGLTSRDRTAA